MTDISEFHDPLIGRKLGQCFIEAPLGQGGMATVYRAIRDTDEAIVAVKVIRRHFAAKPNFVERFEREANLMQALAHRHILPVYEFGSIGDISYLVMQLLTGGALVDLIEQSTISPELLMRFINQICDALDFAHSKGVIHRDLKPANVLLDEDMNAYLTDFGIAKWKEETTGLTLTGMVVGTPGYMSPEQWRTDPVTAQTDVYALGVMFFELMTGQLPFKADTPFSLMYKHLDQPPPFASQLNPTLSPSVDLVLHRAMAKSPEKRYPSAKALATSLIEALLTEEDEISTAIQPVPHDTDEMDNTYHATAPLPEGATSSLDIDRDTYDAIDVGARTLLNRAREAIREGTDDVVILGQAVIDYVEKLRELAKYKPQAEEGPYKALESYDISDNRLFFGRESAIDGMLARSPFAKFTVLHAESGAGKTSLIRAGLMPRLLAGGYLPLYVAVRRRAPHQAIKHVLLPDTTIAPDATEKTSLRTYLSGVAKVVGENREIFIFVDQFETIFTDVFTDEDRASFVNELAECLDDPALQVRITLAMRTEYFGLLASFQPAIDQPFEKEFLLRRLQRDEAKRALVRPVEEQNLEYEEDAVEAILDDLTDEAGEIAPPQLQLVGTALIEKLPDDRHLITKADYEDAGGAQGVLQGFLSRLLQRLPTPDRQPARVILESLVRPDQTRDVRTAEELRAELEALGIPTSNFDNLLRILRENHILRVVDTDEGLAYELVHDYLALQVQIDPETAARKAAQELLDRSVEAYRKYGGVLAREELEVISAQEERLRINSEARELIAISRRLLRRQRRIAITLTIAAILGLVGALGIGLLAVSRESQNRQERLESAQTAEAEIAAQRDVALRNESRRLAELAIQQLDNDPVTSLNLAIEGMTPRDRPYVPDAELALNLAVQDVNEDLYIQGAGAVQAIWNADNSQILLWDNSRDMRIVNPRDGTDILVFPELEAPVVTARWSTDETLILAGDLLLNVYLLDANTGEIVFQDSIPDENPSSIFRVIEAVSWNSTEEYFLAWSKESNITKVWKSSGEAHAILTGAQAQWSPDNTQILTLDNNSSGNFYAIRIWNLDDGEEQIVLRSDFGHTRTIRKAQWFANGEQVLSWGDDNKIVIWDVSSGTELLSQEIESGIRTVELSPDENQLLVSTADGLFSIIDVETEAIASQPLDVVDGISWSEDNEYYVTYGSISAFGLWESKTNQRIAAPNLAQYAEDIRISDVQWHPNGSHIMTISRNHIIRIWEVSLTHGLREVTHLLGHTNSINQAIWNSNGTKVLSSADDGSARIWTVLNNGIEVGHGEIGRFVSSSGETLTAQWNADETLVASGHNNGNVHIWSMTDENSMHQFTDHTGPVKQLAWKNNLLLSGSDDGLAIIWDTTSGETINVFEHIAPVIWVDWNTDGNQIVTTSDDGSARIWDVTSGELLLRLQQTEPDSSIGVARAMWSADESLMLTAGDDGTVRIWDTTTGDELVHIDVTVLLFGASWNADETQILAWGQDIVGGVAGVYDASTGELLFSLEGHGLPVVTASWSPDERFILTTGRDGIGRLWRADDGTPLRMLEGHTDSVINGFWNAEGSRILTSSVDTTARVWDVNTATEIFRIDSLPGINTIRWNMDETTLLTANDDGTVRLWQTWPDLEKLIEHAIQLVTRPLTPEQRSAFFLETEDD